MKVYPQKHRFR